jgi:hypothetical protein
MKAVRYEYFDTMGTIPWDAPKEMRFFPPTTTTMAAPGLSGITSAANVVVVIIMQVKPNWKIAQPVVD